MKITESIVRANAIQLIATHGFDSMSLRQLAKASGIHSGSLYVYYKNKDEILIDLMHDYMDDLLSQWQEHKYNHSSASPRLMLEEFVRLHVSQHTSRAYESLIVNMDWRSLKGEGRTLIESLKEAYEAELKSILVMGSAQGIFHLEDISLTAASIISMLRGACEWFCKDERLAKDKVSDGCSQMALRAVGLAAY